MLSAPLSRQRRTLAEKGPRTLLCAVYIQQRYTLSKDGCKYGRLSRRTYTEENLREITCGRPTRQRKKGIMACIDWIDISSYSIQRSRLSLRRSRAFLLFQLRFELCELMCGNLLFRIKYLCDGLYFFNLYIKRQELTTRVQNPGGGGRSRCASE